MNKGAGGMMEVYSVQRDGGGLCETKKKPRREEAARRPKQVPARRTRSTKKSTWWWGAVTEAWARWGVQDHASVRREQRNG